MKGKIYTLLLAVVAVAMAAGIFASCKDYGEDINNLQDQINKAALKSELTTAQSTLQKAADDAKQAADDAMAEAKKRLSESDFEDFANRLEKILRDHQDSLKTAFDKNFDQDEALKDTASNIRRDMSGMQSQLKNDIEGAKTYAEDKVNDLVRDYRLDRDKLLSTVEYNGVRTLLDRSEELLNMVDQIESLDDFNKAAKKVDDFITLVNALTKAVTSVELIGTFTEDNNIDHMLANHGQATGAPYTMAFYKGTVGETSIFGDEVTTVGTISGKVGYTKGAAIKDTVNILVRVSPVDADLSKLQAESEKNILIVNSRGEALDDWLNIGNPKKYGDLLSHTRATNIGSGIWVIPVAMKPGKDINEFMKVTHPDVKLNNSGELISDVPEVLYAVAIRNTAKNVDTRYAISTYDLISTYENYKPATIFTFKVNDKFVEKLYNRWTGTAIKAEQAETNTNRDYMWRQRADDKFMSPATSFNWQTDGAKAVEAKNFNFNQDGARHIENDGPDFLVATNTDDGFYDERQASVGIDNIITCEVGDPIVVSSLIGGRPQTTADGTIRKANYKETRLDYFYVVIDHIGAIESEPSEFNAWTGYQYEGLNKIYKVGEKCTIKVLSAQAKNDIIGFRVYACNTDGTLADPDGRAFYVKLQQTADHGKAVPNDDLNPQATANDIIPKAMSDGDFDNNASAKNIGLFKVTPPETDWGKNGQIEIKSANPVRATGVGTAATGAWNFGAANGGKAFISSKDFPSQIHNTSATGYSDLELTYWLVKSVDSEGHVTAYASKWSEVKYVQVAVKNIEDWVDASSVDFTITGYEGSSAKNVIDVTIRKTMPSTDNDIPYKDRVEWNPLYKPVNTLYLYPKPDIAWTATTSTPSSVSLNLEKLTTNTAGSNASKYEWVIEKAGDSNSDLIFKSTDSAPYEKTDLDPAIVGKSYNGMLTYAFQKISRTSATSTDDPQDYKVNAWSGTVSLSNALDLVAFKVKEYTYTGTTTVSPYYIKWSDAATTTPLTVKTAADTYGTPFAASLANMLVGNSVADNLLKAKDAGLTTGITGSGSSTRIDVATMVGNYLIDWAADNSYVTLTGDAAIYLKITGYSGGVISIGQRTELGEPGREYTGAIKIVGKDIFGTSHNICQSFPFTLLP